LPYCQPLVIGPAVIDSGTMMLALAARFPAWAVKNGLVRLYPDSGQPHLNRLARINAMLYGLNGYELELARTVQAIAAHWEQRSPAPEPHPRLEVSPVSPAGSLPSAGVETTLPPARSSGRLKPDARTFEQLYRKIGR